MVLMSGALLLLLLVLGRAAAQSLEYRITVRNFLPAACMRASELESAWDGDGDEDLPIDELAFDPGADITTFTVDQNFDPGTGYSTETIAVPGDRFCPYWDFLRNRTIEAHPDFETGSTFFGAGPSRCYFAGVDVNDLAPTFLSIDPVTGCEDRTSPPSTEDEEGDVNIAIRPFMKRASSGLPKLVYCSDGDDDRCGEHLRSGSRQGQFTNSRKKFFEMWFNDDKRYVKRIGDVLSLTDIGGGRFEFASSLFHPLNKYRGIHTEENYPNPLEVPTWPNFRRYFEDRDIIDNILSSVYGVGNPSSVSIQPSQDSVFGFTTELHSCEFAFIFSVFLVKFLDF